ncbi:hypothetical protein CYFUS_002578 [Cystobacter fuscus]|uniref:Methyltransferase domain-containing protein n=1 Tax=Cystobacter fuscus TaxID=43 RepID=A0A250J130_9BACT|nr:class I SAM-dependent methyltransferase [Cystobacter fuscus]ATB37157.1 hypothetical protein CYFUS_002578 [Cystobacter fuscus]
MDQTIDRVPADWVMGLLRCPSCSEPALRRREGPSLMCDGCAAHFPVQEGILDLALPGNESLRTDRPYEGLSGRMYATFMEHPWLQNLDAWLLGMKVEDYYARIQEQLAVLGPGPSLDMPSGGGPFLGRVHTYQRAGPWLFADLSWTMLHRLRRKCEALGLREVVLIRADATRLPLRDGVLNNLVSLFGLHCFHDKASVFGELNRCLKPGGRILASTLTSEGPRRSRFYLKLNQRDGTFAPNNSLHEFREQARHQCMGLRVLNQLGATLVLEMSHG